MPKSFTLQALPDDSATWLDKEAERRGVSAGVVVQDLIARAAKGSRRPAKIGPRPDLDRLAGTWTEAQAKEFLDAVSDFEQVDDLAWGHTLSDLGL